MGLEDPFFQAIAENPDDDTPRLAYADWLVQHGDPRWTFIRVQCELAKADRDDPRRPELEARNRALQAEYNASLRRAFRAPSFLGDHLTNLEYSRGFPERLSLYQNSLIHDFLRRNVADRFFRFVGPVRRIYLSRSPEVL